jgi:tetratricopeptide (TPR) repeat protein
LDKRFEVRCSLGDGKGAESDLNALLVLTEGDAEQTASILSKRADFHIATGELIRAIADYETLLALPVSEERKIEADAELFLFCEHFGENEKALNYLEKILNNPACGRGGKFFALSFREKLFENAGELDKAIANQTAMMDAGYRQDYPIERATLYLKNKNFRAVITDCETILKHNGNSSYLDRIINASILKARAYEGLGEKEKALAEYDLLLEEKESTRYYSDRVPAFWYRGRLHGKSGNRQQEIADIDNLFRVSNRYSFDLKNFLREDDNYHDTADAAQKAIQDYSAIPVPPEKKIKRKREKTNYTRSTLYYLRGLAWKKLGETAKANSDFRQALTQDNLPASLKNELNFLLQ